MALDDQCGGEHRVSWREGVEEQEASWQAVPMVQLRRNKGLFWNSDRGNGKKRPKSHCRRGKARTWRSVRRDDWPSLLHAGKRSKFQVRQTSRTQGRQVEQCQDKGEGQVTPAEVGWHSRAFEHQKCTGSARAVKQSKEKSEQGLSKACRFSPGQFTGIY